MKRTSLKSSTKTAALASSTIIFALFMGQTALAGPDKEPAETETTKIERIIVEDAEKTDATAMPNAAIENDVTAEPAETIESNYSIESDPDAPVDAAEDDVTAEDADTIIIDNPDAVIISNPDSDADADEDAGESPEK